MPLKVLFAASECSPLVKVGGLGDVIGSLPKALFELGVDVRIVLPKYGIIDERTYPSRLIASGIQVGEPFDAAQGKEKIDVYQAHLPQSNVIIYLLDNEKFFREDGVYLSKTAFVDSFKGIERFLFFSMAVLEIFQKINWIPDILHCHDWHTAILPMLAKVKSKIQNTPKTLLTIHNLENQGKGKAETILKFLNLAENESETLKIREKGGDFNILKQGIMNAGVLNTVSPAYKKEILTKECGAGLEKSLLKRQKDLFGILNGIDVKSFDPKTDKNIRANYSFANTLPKAEDKIDLQKILNFEEGEDVPFFGLVSRLTDQKGIDLIIEIIPELVKLGGQLVVLGTGSDRYEKKLIELGNKYPKNISAQIRFDAVLGQKIYAGCDIFLMPSLFEPCGLGQMIAMRYGTLPIVRKTGGLSDTVLNGKTGFVFEKYDGSSLLEAVISAVNLYKNKNKWRKMIQGAMEQDFSWKKSAKEYLKLYERQVD